MIAPIDPASQAFLFGLDQVQQRFNRAQLELTTGLRINTVSDDPALISSLAQIQSQIAQNTQITQNLGQVKLETDTAEQALSSAVTQVEQAQQLGTQGASSFASPQTQQTLATQVGSILENLVGIASTTVEGRHIFSGDADQINPYTVNLALVNPVSAYLGSAATRQVQHPDGSLIPVSLTAQQIFDSGAPGNNVYQSLNAMRLALQAGDINAINAALPGLKSAGTFLNQQLAFYGTVQTRIAGATTYAANQSTSLQTQLSTIRDADSALAITELTLAQTQEQAAFESRAKLPRGSLFDFLA